MNVSLEHITWPKQGEVNIAVSPEISGLKRKMNGTLQVSQEGYVYSPSSKKVTWFKFLGLALSLPIYGCIMKCREMANRCLGHETPSKGYHDLGHVCHLSKIAWKAVVGAEGKSLPERVEEFALAEMDYNNGNREDEINRARSDRLTEGMYAARCMQPLFHKDQYQTSPMRLRDRLELLYQDKNELETALYHKESDRNPEWISFRKLHTFVASRYNSYAEWKENDIQNELERVNREIEKIKPAIETAERCQKYAVHAIFSQQSSFTGLTDAVTDAVVQTDADVKCMGQTCYKQERICGIVYKIDCCATRCWAIDCLCCMLCIWPEGRTWDTF